MSHSYEMMFILRPDLNEEQVSQQMRKYYNFLKEHGADKVGIKVWGKRRLAYPIQKFQDGIYILVNYTSDGSPIAPIERAMRLSEEVIRYLTIKLREDIEIESTEIPEVKLSEIETKPEVQVSSTPSKVPEIHERKPVAIPERKQPEISEPTETPELNKTPEATQTPDASEAIENQEEKTVQA